MERRKREPMSERKKNIIAELIQEYDIQSAEDIQDALKDLLGGTIQEMLEAEMDEYLCYVFLASRFSSIPEVNFSSTPFPLLGFYG